jgi:hypothetical protein
MPAWDKNQYKSALLSHKSQINKKFITAKNRPAFVSLGASLIVSLRQNKTVFYSSSRLPTPQCC